MDAYLRRSCGELRKSFFGALKWPLCGGRKVKGEESKGNEGVKKA